MTWYSHNAQRKHRTHVSTNNLAGTGAGVQSGLLDVASSPPIDIDVKGFSKEEDPLDLTDQMDGSDLVSI